MTPQERGSIFANYEYDINEAVQLYAEVLYSRTSSGFQIAPLPFDALADDVVISADSYYNPFGYDFGGATTGNPNLTVRLEALGNRRSKTSSDSKVAKVGARGPLFGSEWNYDFLVGYSRLDQTDSVSGYLYQPGSRGRVRPVVPMQRPAMSIAVRYARRIRFRSASARQSTSSTWQILRRSRRSARSPRATTPIVSIPRSRPRSRWTARCSPCRPATRSCRSRRTTPSCVATSMSTSSSRPRRRCT